MCTKNYILLNRNLLINDLWNSEPFTRGQAWVDLLLNTNWKDSTAIIKGVSIPVKRGQACRSVKQLAIRWKWSEGKVKRYMDLLVSLGQISYETWGKNGAVNGAVKTGLTTLITILNYNTYQLDGAANGAQTERKQSADEAQTETYKKGKKGEEGKEGKACTPTETALRECMADNKEMLAGKYPDADLEIELEEMVSKYRGVSIGADPFLIISRWMKNLPPKREPPPRQQVPDKFDAIMRGMR